MTISKVVNLKLEDYGWSEIAKTLRLGKKRVQNIWFYFVKNFQLKCKTIIKELID
jgi:hypothetical protein